MQQLNCKTENYGLDYCLKQTNNMASERKFLHWARNIEGGTFV